MVKNNTNVWKITTIVLAVLLIAAIVAIMIPKTNKNLFDSGNVNIAEDVKQKNQQLSDNDPSKGDKKAPIVMIEFSDFQCPFCAKFYSETYKQIETDYINTGKVRIVFRDLPLSFHENAQKAAEAAECANEQGKFWEMHDKLFENQQALEINDLKKYASDLNLDATKFNNCLDTGKYASEIQKDAADAEVARQSKS